MNNEMSGGKIMNRWKRLTRYALSHRLQSATAALVIILVVYGIARVLGGTSTATSYTLAPVQKTTIISSISGTGQVSAETSLDLKPKASGEVVYVSASDGQFVPAGTLIAKLDTTDAEKVARDAQSALESAKLSLAKMQEPTDVLTILQTENAISQATDTLSKSYDDGFNAISNTFVDLPSIITGLHDILYGTTVSHGSQDNISAYSDMVRSFANNVSTFQTDATNKYQAALTAYNANYLDYKNISRLSDRLTLQHLMAESYATTKTLADTVKSVGDLLSFVKDQLSSRLYSVPAILSTHQSLLSTYTTETNTHLSDLSSSINIIQSTSQTLAEKMQSLAEQKSGADPLDIASAELSVKQKENALLDARDALDNYYVTAPFDGILANVTVKKFDSVSSGTVIASLITRQKIAQISLNEVDAAKIKTGDKAILTFDAIDGLSISGQVIQIDTLGAVSQGVVTYGVKIGFDTQDQRVKSGMSVNASIITSVKQDVLAVPRSAVKMNGQTSYVQILPEASAGTASDNGRNQTVSSLTPPTTVTVETGVSNDNLMEITSGLTEGEMIIVRTVTQTTTASSQAPSLFGGGTNRGGGNFRLAP